MGDEPEAANAAWEKWRPTAGEGKYFPPDKPTFLAGWQAAKDHTDGEGA